MTETNIGVLALQGAFREHIKSLQRVGVGARRVRLPADLIGLDGLIIPGGESTTIGKLARMYNLLTPLQRLAHDGFPMWGTCAGLILLADRVTQRAADQPLIGGLDIFVFRNYFGRQIDSFEADLTLPALAPFSADGQTTFHAVFIRAPAVMAVGPNVEVLARLDGNPDGEGVIVAVRQGALLATAFHPELTADIRFHRYFVALATEAGRRVTDLDIAAVVLS